jgi:NADH:ubiquinone oxidoreductase subunit 2 (subunit N)
MKVSLVLVASTIVCLVMSREYLQTEKILFFEYSVLILLSCLGGC